MQVIVVIIYLLIFSIVVLASYAFMQLKLVGIKVKDFWGFIEANQILDKLYNFAKQYDTEVLNKYKDIRMIRWSNN